MPSYTGQRPQAEGRGRSILKKETVNTATGTIPRRPHASDAIPSGVGSPLAKHPGNCTPQGNFMFRMQLKVTYNFYIDLRPPSRKREHQDPAKAPRGDTHPVASAEDRAATISSDHGPEEGDSGAAPKGQKYTLRPE